MESKKAISLPPNDGNRIVGLLEEESPEFMSALNHQLKNAFGDNPGLQSRIEIVDVEHGGFEGEKEQSGGGTSVDGVSWLGLNSFSSIVILC